MIVKNLFLRILLLLVFATVLLYGCATNGAEAPAETDVEETELAPTPIPPTAEPEIILRLSATNSKDTPIQLEVLKGKYKLATGAELWEGSSVFVNESMMNFLPGLAIDVGDGRVTLKSQEYPAGTQLIVSGSGSLVER